MRTGCFVRARFGHADKSVIGKLLEMPGILKFSGEGGIRTLDRLTPILVFETSAFNHSATSPT